MRVSTSHRIEAWQEQPQQRHPPQRHHLKGKPGEDATINEPWAKPNDVLACCILTKCIKRAMHVGHASNNCTATAATKTQLSQHSRRGGGGDQVDATNQRGAKSSRDGWTQKWYIGRIVVQAISNARIPLETAFQNVWPWSQASGIVDVLIFVTVVRMT